MKVFTANFRGHYPVGSAAVIVAKNHSRAVVLLLNELEKQGLAQTLEDITVVALPIDKEGVAILVDGNY